MRLTCKNWFLASIILSASPLRAENAVVLESFETGIGAATVDLTPDGRPALHPAGVTLSQYSKNPGSDGNVTEGSKSLKFILSGKKNFSRDFSVKLSPEASDKLRQATASKDVARYLLRYDVIFPPMDNFIYCNSTLLLGDSRDVLISSGGVRTMSVALDLLTGLPASGPVTLDFANDFDVKSEFTNVVIYLDNLRLVDTYAPGAKPVVHILQSFEDASDPTGGAVNFMDWDGDKGQSAVRTTFSQYKSAGAEDASVTEGSHALEVFNINPTAWHADFVIPFNHTMLADVLQLDKSSGQRPTPEQLSHYTLRWDVTYPELTNEWINSTYSTIAGFLPFIQGSQNNAHRRLTYSVTLDQTEWGTWHDMMPVLLFITEGPQTKHDTKIYYDNFRLIDTGSAAGAKKEKAGQ